VVSATVTGFARMENTTRQSGLDGLRGLAALAVFAIHLWIYQLPNTVKLNRDGVGELALFEGRVAFVLFFVLSGYLLYRPFARAALQAGKPVPTGSYLLRRAARIVPAYYLALLGTLALVAAAGDVPGRRIVDADQLPLFFAFAQNYSPETLLQMNAATWTLSVEVAFYLLLPIIGLVALWHCRSSVRAQLLLLASLVVVGVGWNAADYLAGWGPVASHAAPAFLSYFACGMLVALLVERQRARKLPGMGMRLSAVLACGALAVLLANGYWHAADRTPDGFLMEVIADLPAAVAFGTIIAALVLGTGSGLRWLGRRPLAWFGQISYGFYLWHIPLIVWARGHGLLDGSAPFDVAVMLPIAVSFGAASWYFVEQPLMKRAARQTGSRARRANRSELPVFPAKEQPARAPGFSG
jgi:peptidoglycan/LPS O-acetylase OafA/YrhL